MEVTAEGIGHNAVNLLRRIKAAQYVRAHPGEVCPAKWEEGEKDTRSVAAPRQQDLTLGDRQTRLPVNAGGRQYVIFSAPVARPQPFWRSAPCSTRTTVPVEGLSGEGRSPDRDHCFGQLTQSRRDVGTSRRTGLFPTRSRSWKRAMTESMHPSFTLTSPGRHQSAFRRRSDGPSSPRLCWLCCRSAATAAHRAGDHRSDRDLDGDFLFETYFSLLPRIAPMCAGALNLMAVLNPRVKHVAVDGGVFPAEVQSRQVMSVPTVYLNGQLFRSGENGGRGDRLEARHRSAGPRAASINSREAYDVLVIGGETGWRCGSNLRRARGIRTGVAAERFGGQVLDFDGDRKLHLRECCSRKGESWS